MGVNIPHNNIDVVDRWNRAFLALSQEPRRELLLSLTNEPASVWIPLPDAALSPHYSGSREDLRISLQHQHLPHLADHGYIVWEDSPFEVRQGPHFGEIEAILRAIITSSDGLPDRLVTDCRTLESRVSGK